MTIAQLVDDAAANVGDSMMALVHDLFPICRSITGDGVRATLERIAKEIPLSTREVPSGTHCYDWTVPDEWNVRDAYVSDVHGRRVIDFQLSTLHLMSYSEPVRTRLRLDELRPHLHTLPEHPDWIPYRTSYYDRTWGFCLTQRQLDSLDDGPYDVVIDGTLKPGSLSYGEYVLPGELQDEVLVSTHVCHPSMANDNLSGIAVGAAVASLLATVPLRHTYRFVFVPGTIGSITWLARNESVVPRIRHGLVLTGLGGPGPLVWKRSRRGDRPIDLAGEHVVTSRDGQIRDFSPWGYDERQYNSLGFDLPVGRLTRTPHGEYAEYHTSADSLSFVTVEAMTEAVTAVLEIVDILENDSRPRNLSPMGEPQLGRRGLYPRIGGRSADEEVMAMLWVLSLADGAHSMLDIARRAGVPFALVRRAADKLGRAGLLTQEQPSAQPIHDVGDLTV